MKRVILMVLGVLAVSHGAYPQTTAEISERALAAAPLDAGGFHGDGGDPTGDQPIREAVEVGGEGPEELDRGRVPIGGNGHIVLGGAVVDAGDIDLNTFEHRGRATRGRTGGDCASSKPPAYCEGHPGSGRRCGEHSSKRDHAGGRVTSDQTATPRATLRHGFTGCTCGQIGLGSRMLR